MNNNIKINIIVACTAYGVIGKGNELLTHCSEDLKRFKVITMGNTILMGRKTHESIGRSLNGRDNIVLTRNRDFIPFGASKVINYMSQVYNENVINGDLFICGGSQVYKLFANKCDSLYLTIYRNEYKGDKFFDYKSCIADNKLAVDSIDEGKECMFYVYKKEQDL